MTSLMYSIPPKLTLLTLPLEIRRLIYTNLTHQYLPNPSRTADFAPDDSFPSLAIQHHDSRGPQTMYRRQILQQEEMLLCPLRLTCNQIYQETLDFVTYPELKGFLSASTFRLPTTPNTQDAMAKLKRRVVRENLVQIWLTLDRVADIMFGRRYDMSVTKRSRVKQGFLRFARKNSAEKEKEEEEEAEKMRISRIDAMKLIVGMLKDLPKLRLVMTGLMRGEMRTIELGGVFWVFDGSLGGLEGYVREWVL